MVIYVIGPFREYVDGDGESHSIEENVKRARRAGEDLIDAGHQVIIPHNNTFQLHENDWDTEKAMAQDLPIMERCDAVYVLEDSLYSEGSQDEIEHAKEQGMSVYYAENGVPDLHITEQRCPVQSRAFIQMVMQMYRTHLDKNADYSPANILGTGKIGVVTRLWDKMARIMELTGFELKVEEPATYNEPKEAMNESLEDSFMDLANYGVISKLLHEEKWGR